MDIEKRSPNSNDAFFVALVAFLGFWIFNVLALPIYALLRQLDAHELTFLGVVAIVAEAGIFIPMLVYLRIRKVSLKQALGLEGRPTLPLGFFALLATVGCGFLLDHASYVAGQIFPNLKTGPLIQVGQTLAEASVLQAIALAIPLALAPALCEEFVCRGAILNGLRARFASPIWPIVLSSVFFGALHQDPFHASLASIMGVVFGIIAIRTGSIHMPIICHLVNNLASIFTPVLGGPSLPQVMETGHSTTAIAFGCVAFVVGLTGLFLWPRKAQEKDKNSEKNEQQSPSDAHDSDKNSTE